MEAEKKVESISAKSSASPKERSTIEFPYLDLENAVEIATGVHEVGGSGCEWDQLAAHLKQAAQGGGFRLRLICAKQFGVVTYDRGKIALTSLGLKIVDPQQQRQGKIDSFLQIPLYKAIYDKFRGGTLPPLAGLEREMQALGVATKQADKARQAFQRSAKYAGFFEFGTDRLVAPSSSQSNQEAPPPPAAANANNLSANVGGSGGGEGQHPFIEGLLQKLPPPDTDWTYEGRAKWLSTAANIFDLLYTCNDIKLIELQVKSI